MVDNIKDRQNQLVIPVATAVLAVWVASAFYSFYSGQYAPLTISTPVMLVLAGYVFGFRAVTKAFDQGRNGNGNGVKG